MFICTRGKGCRIVGDDSPEGKAFAAMMDERDKLDMDRVEALSPAQRVFAEGLTRACHRRRYRGGKSPAEHAGRPVIPIEGVYVLDYLCSAEGQAAIEAMGREQEGGTQ